MKVLVRTVVCAAVVGGSVALAQVGDSYKVQSPQLAAPERGSLAGSLSGVAFGPGDVGRGTFSLPSPYGAPEERGPLLASVFPSYSAEAGISEWGMGWASDLSLTRWRASGTNVYASEDLTGPFGRCQKGSDGYWYPTGLGKLVRIEASGSGFIAYTSDGTRWRFGTSTRTATAKGTYAWHLDEVETVTGRRAALTYEKNASGRPFLKQVDYGGVGTAYEHRVTIDYVALAKTFTDYRAGTGLVLDRRVSAVKAWSLHAVARAWQVRWSFTPSYRADPVSPAFYLAQVDQAFASGEQAPPVRYAYELSADSLPLASLARSAKFDRVVADYGATIVLPSYSTGVDPNADGLQDLEVASDNTLLVQGPTGYSYQPLPPRSATARLECRVPASAFNAPRTLAAMRAGSDEVQVVSLSATTSTRLLLCDRAGEPLFETTLANVWTLGPKTRLVDLNRDQQPDLIQVFNNGYQVIPNNSTAAGYSFGAPIAGTLNLAFPFTGIWLHDFNGDGLPDIITRTGTVIVVYFGLGDFKFDATPRTYPVLNFQGQALSPSTYAFTWVDADKDGLIDLVLSTSSAAFLFRNSGSAFVPVQVGGQNSVAASSYLPLFLDLNGSGNAEVFFILGGAGYSLALNGPGTGLLKTADDGKGTVLRFGYERAAPAPGARSRQSVLAHLTVESSGNDIVTYDFAYGTPRLHSVGKFLLGFDRVTRTDPLLTHTVDFLNDDQSAGVVLGSAKVDALVAGLERYETRTYDDALFQGIPWKRPKEQVSGWRGIAPGGPPPVAETVTHLGWDRTFCPAQVRKVTSSGTLITEKHYVDRPAFGLALVCLADSIVEAGTHVDTTFDFRHETFIQLNDKGLPERVESVSGAERLVQQNVTYTPEWRVWTVASPGMGTSTFDWPAGAHVLKKVTMPDGSTVEVVERDPTSDAIKALRTTHGTVSFDQFFRFDGQERLQKQWDTLGGATETNPNVLVNAYRYATATTPGAVSASVLVEASGKARDTRDLVTAAGEPITTASRIPEGWSFGSLVTRSRVRGETKSHVRPTVAAPTEPALLTHADLLAGASEIERKTAGPLGVVTDHAQKFHVDVERRAAESLYLDPAFLLVKNVRENGAYDRTWATDAGGTVLSFSDEARNTWAYRHDALGRLREVVLPDGKRHRARYDGHGRISRIERDDVATVEYLFAPVTGLLQEKRFYPPPGTETQTRYLSDLAPASEAFGWSPAKMDRAISGNPITLNGAVYAKGIGAHAESNLTYDLSGQSCSLFQADVGLDDAATGTCGGVSFEVYGDGRKLFDSGYMVSSTATRQVALSISGIAKLRLRVTLGTDGNDYCDHADWAEARVVCAASSPTPLQVGDLPRAAETFTWAPAVKDRSIAGNPLTLDGVQYAKGIGAHAESNLTYDLAGKACTLFQADVGVDDEVKSACRGNVTFEVWGDDTLLAATAPLDVWKNRQALAVSVAGRSKLRLRVTKGSDGVDTCDHADWASPRLTCAAAPLRSVAYGYDAIGRVKEEAHAEGGATKRFTWLYDGATPASPLQSTTLGFLTGVTGDGFAKTLDYWPDGKLKQRTLAVSGWRKVETSFTYTESRDPKQRTTRLLDSSDVPISTTTEVLGYDTYGRLGSTTRNGAPFATLNYDQNGILNGATFPGPTSLTLTLDGLTRAVTGSSMSSSSGTVSTAQRMSARGLVDWEDFSAGATTRRRTYGYHPQRFLSGSTDPAATYGYTFDPTGLPSTITKGTATRTLVRSGNTLVVGSTTYTFDSLGRTTQRSDSAAPATKLTLAYGADGQVAMATKGAATWSFLYDEAGQRIAKFAGAVPVGTPLEVYAEEGFLDATGLTEPVKAAGRTVGLWKAGVFTPLSTDLRGSVMAEGGALKLASPFGQRDVHPSMARVIEYVEKGYDADLGTVRMGVRDYDPEISRFTTADPLFLERPEECANNATDCTLYAYSSNAPTAFVDPTGECTATSQGLDCASASVNTENYLARNAQENWSNGHYAFAATSALLYVANLPNVAVGYAAQMIVQPGNATYKATSGFMEGNYDKALEGSVETLAAFTLARMSGGRVPPGAAAPSVWSLQPFARGRVIERALGANLTSPNYPVIDRFLNGIATSIKSIDLGAKSYQNIATLTRTLQGYVDDVAAFAGRNWGGVNIQASQIAGRELAVAIPPGASAAQMAAIRQIAQQAANPAAGVNAVRVTIHVIQ